VSDHPPVSLIGYRGTGKSTVARLLAQRLGRDFFDADDELEARAGKTIREVFAEEGEPGFRDREADVLAELCRRGRCVIATGGGVVLRPDNRRRLKERTFPVWLTADPETIWQRLQQDDSTSARRPALTVGGLEEVRQLLAAREPLYRDCARWAVDTAARTPEEVANLIDAHLGGLTWI
jgi:shikimate kinase